MQNITVKWHLAVVVLILLALLIIMRMNDFHHSSEINYQKIHAALEHEIRLDAESELNMLMLLNRHIYHYDQLTASTHRLQQGMFKIDHLIHNIAILSKYFERVQASVDIQTHAINDFKSDLGVLINSQRYFPTFIKMLIDQYPQHTMALRIYSENVYQYLLQPDDEHLKKVLTQSDEKFLDIPELTRHVHILLTYGQRVQGSIEVAVNCGTAENIQKLSKHFDMQYEHDLKVQNLQKYALKAMIILLLIYLSFLAWRVVSLIQEKSKNHNELLKVKSQLEEKVHDLSKLEQRLRKLFDVIPDAVIVHQYGRCLFANPAAIKMYGHKKNDDLVGKNVLKYIHKDDRSQVAQRIRDSKQVDRVPLLLEKHVRLDGSIFFVEAQGVSFEEDGKQVWVVLLHDVTQRLQEEKESLALKSAMEHSQRLESLGVLAGGIAHDFNNLLSVIMGNVELIKHGVTPSNEVKKYIGNTLKATDKAAGLCQQMLAYSGRGQFIVQAVQLTSLIQDTAELLQVSMKKNITIHYDLNESLPRVQVDQSQIQQIILNLMTNANESMESGSIVCRTGVCHVSHDALKDMTYDWGVEAGDFVFVEVQDQGCGMDQKTLNKIFDPFFTTKFTGRGLGMSAVLGIVRAHHGALDVHSEVGKGTCFRLLLPWDKTNNPSENMPLDVKTDKGRKQGTVLLVDDEAMIRDVACQMLENMGLKVLQAEDGLEAVEVYQSSDVPIGMVLLDMTMPKMDGKACFVALKKINPDVRVVISSGYHASEIQAEFSEYSLAAVVQKPYKYEKLKDIVMSVL